MKEAVRPPPFQANPSLHVHHTGPMDEKQLQKLIKKNAAAAAKLAKARDGRKFDKTLQPPQDADADVERTAFFKEMKRREF
jgi:hypothetical protein